MIEFRLDEQTFQDFKEGLEEIRQLKANPADELARKRFEKKWQNHEVQDVLELFMAADA